MITAEDINKFDGSAHVKKCVQDLKKSPTINNKVSMKLFTNCRDYLLISLCLDNAQRSGAIGNMTLDEFTKAKAYQNGSYQVYNIPLLILLDLGK